MKSSDSRAGPLGSAVGRLWSFMKSPNVASPQKMRMFQSVNPSTENPLMLWGPVGPNGSASKDMKSCVGLPGGEEKPSLLTVLVPRGSRMLSGEPSPPPVTVALIPLYGCAPPGVVEKYTDAFVKFAFVALPPSGAAES